MTLQEMCKRSHHIRVLKIAKRDKEKGVIVFELAQSLKSAKSDISPFKHVIRTEAEGAKRILDWAEDGKTAVMFSIEAGDHGIAGDQGIGYVCIDEYWYSVHYKSGGKYWLMIRGEPSMSACYHGSVKWLRDGIKDILDGKEVKVSVKEPATKEDRDKRREEINDILKKKP
jgi:hypothetical protein